MSDESVPPTGKPPGKRARKSARSADVGAPLPPQMEVERDVKESTRRAESEAEIASRLRIAEQDAEHERWKERSEMIALFVVVGAIVLASLAIIAFSPKTNLQNFATGALMAVPAYFAGKQNRVK